MSVYGTFAPGNTKLGERICGWSLPAGTTCPGASGLCRRHCYGVRGFYYCPSVTECLERNLVFSRTMAFVPWAIDALRSIAVLRVHVVGDFYESHYIQQWQQIVQESPETRFYAYTRSWRCDEMLHELVRLSRMPNMSLWWSMDWQTGAPPAIRGVRTAYMAVNDIDAAHVPSDVDLVFREHRLMTPPLLPMRFVNGVLVCPVENGIGGRHHTCSRCGICWRGPRPPRWENRFEEVPATTMAVVGV